MHTEVDGYHSVAPAVAELTSRLADALPTDGRQVELSVIWQKLELSRFSDGRVHQNVGDAGPRVWARVWDNGGTGHAMSSRIDPASLSALMDRALANVVPSDRPAIELPAAVDAGADPWFDATADLDADARGSMIGDLHDAAGTSVSSHGNIRVAAQTHAIANTAGLRTGYRSTYAAMNFIARAEGGANGYGGAIGRDINRLDLTAAAKRAADIAMAGRRPVVAPPGEYEVLLDPPAVSMILVSLGYVGLNSFGAASARAANAWFRPGQRIGSAGFTMADDPLDEAALFSPYDAEGTPRQRLSLVDAGTVSGVAHDLTSAAMDGTVSTGHALPPGDKGASPHSLSIPAGTTSRDEIIAGMTRGLVVTRVHPFVSLRGGPRGELSGTTRDGVFLVENGRIVAPVTNVRWSNAMGDLFGGVEATSRERSVEFMDLPEFSPHTAHVPSIYSTRFTVQSSQPRER